VDEGWQSTEVTARLEEFLADGRETPYLVVDLDVVADRYRALAAALPGADLYYAVKANPAPEVIRLLAELGCSFDVASPGEVDLCVDLGIPPARISFGNTIKKASAIRHAVERGVAMFAFDSEDELGKLTALAATSTLFCRILSDGAGADWPLSRKFGCQPELALDLLVSAHRAGHPVGLSFHVGSQQRDPMAWDRCLAQVADLVAALRAEDVEPALVNIGGGFPGRYREAVPDTSAYGAVIMRSLRRRLGPSVPRIVAEPGRYLVADAGVIQSEVVMVSRKARFDEQRWVFLDVGMFGGLAEVLGESIRYPVRTPHDGGPTGPVVLAGPTCDSADILYEHSDYRLPLALQTGDRVELLSTGAYTQTYSSVGFNGFPPLRAYVLPRSST
jgi:ornithine decarboxylase